MKPILKWTGGKRREIPFFKEYIPKFSNYVEPFCGGAALYWHLNCPNSVISDWDAPLVNFYIQLATNPNVLLERLKELKQSNGDHSAMERLYYQFRSEIIHNKLEKAARFCYVNQLAFSGMRRFNSDGQFNVPFGHYKSFNPQITKKHLKLLETTTIIKQDGCYVISDLSDCDDTFIFVDPPYTRVFKEYSADNCFDDKKQLELFKTFANLKKAKCMIVIDSSELTRDIYQNYIWRSYALKYGVNIKNRFSTNVEHLIITNYNDELRKTADKSIFD